MLTNQYFRGSCLGHAKWLKEHPEYLLSEIVSFSFGESLGGGKFFHSLGAQLVPYLIWELLQINKWPYLYPRDVRPLEWEIIEKKAA